MRGCGDCCLEGGREEEARGCSQSRNKRRGCRKNEDRLVVLTGEEGLVAWSASPSGSGVEADRQVQVWCRWPNCGQGTRLPGSKPPLGEQKSMERHRRKWEASVGRGERRAESHEHHNHHHHKHMLLPGGWGLSADKHAQSVGPSHDRDSQKSIHAPLRPAETLCCAPYHRNVESRDSGSLPASIPAAQPPGPRHQPVPVCLECVVLLALGPKRAVAGCRLRGAPQPADEHRGKTFTPSQPAQGMALYPTNPGASLKRPETLLSLQFDPGLDILAQAYIIHRLGQVQWRNQDSST